MNTAMKKNTARAVLIAGLLVLTACHRYDCRSFSAGRNMERSAERIAQKLKLDPVQKFQLERLLSRTAERRYTLASTHRMAGEVFIQLDRDVMDETQLQAIATESIRELEGFSRQVIADLAAFHRTLTPEQKSRLKTLLADADSHRRFLFPAPAYPPGK